MIIFCSAISLVIVLGHLISIFQSKSYWPFDYYPMYSLPLHKVVYPIIQGEKLTLFSLIDVSDDSNPKDLMSQSGIFPPAFHPLDKLDISYILIQSMPYFSGPDAANKQRMEESTREVHSLASSSNSSVEKTLQKLMRLAHCNQHLIQKIRLIQLEWENFRDPKTSYRHPDRIVLIGETNYA
jgi:hypothetical protein